MKKKKLVLLTAAMAAAGLVLGGCTANSSPSSDSTPDSSKPVTLTFMNRWPEDTYAPYFQSIATAYEKAHPNVTIKINEVGNQNYQEQLELLTGQNKTPDLFWATPGNLTGEFVNADLAEDLTSALGKDGWKQSFDQKALDGYKVDGRYYGIPIQSNYKFMAYNPAIFKEAGISYPSTLSELIRDCSALKQQGVTPIAFGNAEGWPALHYMTVLDGYYVPAATLAKDESSTKKPGKWSDPGYKQALEALLDLQKSCFAPGAQTAGFDTARSSFLGGKAAMYAGSFGEIGLISKNIDKTVFPDDWAIANIPAPSDGDGNTNAVAGAGNGIVVKKGPNAAVAVDFLRFMTSTENAAKMPGPTGWISAVTKANTAENTIPQTSTYLRNVVAKSDDVNMWLDNALPAKTTTAYTSALEGLLGGQLTPDQVLQTLRTTKP